MHTPASTSPANPSSPEAARARRLRSQAGFTLMEAVIATGILITGLAAVSNLMLVSVGTNSAGNRASTASFLASQRMEEMRAASFETLADSPLDSLDTNQANFFRETNVDGVGTFRTRWRVQTVVQFGASLKYLSVRTEPIGAMATMSRAEFTTYRSCTSSACLP
jgi:Tfp pilus assembly protein PilV